MLLILTLSHFLWSQTPLEGRWAQPCLNSVTREEIFQSDEVTLLETYHFDRECQRPFMVFNNHGTVAASGGKMDFTFKKVSIKIVDEGILRDFNFRKVCALPEWILSVEHDVSGARCQLFTHWSPLRIPNKEDRRYGIYQIEENKEGDRLYFGRLTKDHDALSPEKRPLELDPRYYIRKTRDN